MENQSSTLPERPLAVFDLDGTLVNGDTLLPFLVRFGLRRRKTALLSLAWVLFLYGCRILSAHSAKQRLLRRVLGGFPASAIIPEVDAFCTNWVGRNLNEVMIRRLNEHREARHRVILLTASPSVYVPAVAQLLGIGEVVCTQVRWDTGVCTGDIDGENCKGEEKLRRLQAHLGQLDPPAEAYAYGDSASDMPVLRWAGRGYLLTRRKGLAPVPALSAAARE